MFWDRILGKSSIELKRTTQGNTFAVKVYGLNPLKAKSEAEEIFQDLEEKYG